MDIEGDEVEFEDYPAIARGYCEAIIAGRDVASRMVKLACQRYLDMLAMAENPACEFYFSVSHVVDYLDFQENLSHIVSGRWELFAALRVDGTPDPSILLEPFQIWIECAIHGFRWRRTGERLVSQALEMMPRKQAKTEKLVGAALYDLVGSGQIGAEIVIAAASDRQADETLYGALQKMLAVEPDLIERFKIESTNDEIRSGAGKIFKLTSKGEKHDGLNPSLALFEEGHAGAMSVFKVVKSAFGARPNALLRMISTAGYRTEGPAYEMSREARMILTGQLEDFTFFAAIYELDDEDYLDPKTKIILWDKLLSDESLLFKANPMYGISLDPVKLRTDAASAKRRQDLRHEFGRTRYNIWAGSGQALISGESWQACERKVSIEQFYGQKCWIGVDLASVLDMCAIGYVFEVGDDIVVFAKFFLPRESPTAQDVEIGDFISAWAELEDGSMILTDGAMADHDRVNEEIEIACDVFDVQVIACDPKQAHNTIKMFWDGEKPIMTYPNTADTMTAPLDDIIGRIVAQKLGHDGNPVLAWNANNVHGERKPNGSILPRKDAPNSKRKIDGFVAVCMANGVRITPQNAVNPKEFKGGRSAYAGDNVIGA